jgi:hypothetical protein
MNLYTRLVHIFFLDFFALDVGGSSFVKHPPLQYDGAYGTGYGTTTGGTVRA